MNIAVNTVTKLVDKAATFLQDDLFGGVFWSENQRLIVTTFLLLLTFAVRLVAMTIINRNVEDVKRRYHAKRFISYLLYTIATIGLIFVWLVEYSTHIAGFVGLIGAGLAVAMHETVSNVSGWLFIMLRKPFRVGERIEINGLTGDVIDVRMFEFSMIEVGGQRLAGGEQSTGRIIHVPNGMVLRQHVANYDTGFSHIWDEVPILLTFESDWEKAKELMLTIVSRHVETFSQSAAADIHKAAERYLIFTGKLTPIVYTSIEDSGIKLTMRYMVMPRQKRGTRQSIYEDVLREFAKQDKIEFAYPTIRYFDNRTEGGPPVGRAHGGRVDA